MKKAKTVLSLLLAAVLLFSALSLTAYAEESNLADTGAIISGTTGSASYSLDDRGSSQGYKLSVSNGDTAVYSTPVSNAPWMTYKNKITRIDVKDVGNLRSGFFACPSGFAGRDSALNDTGLTVTLDNFVSCIHPYAFVNAHITKLETSRLSYHNGYIGDYAFYNNDFTSVKIESFKYIEEYSFAHCKNLTSVRFDSAETEVQDSAFFGCSNINYVYWPGTPASFKAKVHTTGNSALLNAKTIEFAKKTPIEVTSPVYLTVTEPMVGMTPDYSVFISSSSYCELNPDGTGKSLTIFNKTKGKPQNNDTYTTGNIYIFTARIKGKTGKDSDGYAAQYIITDKTPIYINNKRADTVTFYSNGEIASAGYSFAAKPATYVDSVNLTITEPKAGAKPNFTVTKDNNNCDFYNGLGVLVQNGTGLEFIDHSKGEPDTPLFDIAKYITKDETFKAGQKYTARVFLSTADKTDTYFGKSLTVKINGKTATVSDVSSGKETLCCADYTFTVGSSSSYIVGDVNGDGKVNGADSGILKRYTAGWSGYATNIKNMNAADINRDGSVNGADSGLLKRYTAGWSGYDKYITTVSG